MRLAAKGLPLVCVNPTIVFGPGDLHVTSTRLVRSFLLGRVPAYADGALNMVDVRDVATGQLLADAARRARRALHPRRAQLHLRPPVRRPRAPERGGPAAQGSARAGRGRGRRSCASAPGSTTLSPQEVLAGSQWWTYRSTKAKRELGWKARPHEETLEATVALVPRARARPHRALAALASRFQYRVAGAAIAVGEQAAGSAAGYCAVWASGGANLRRVATLYRCKAPTDLVCRCGKVARRLRAAGIEFDEVRVPVPQARPAGGRGADRPALGARAGARRGGRARVAPDPRVHRPPVRARGRARQGGAGLMARQLPGRRRVAGRASRPDGRRAWPVMLMA